MKKQSKIGQMKHIINFMFLIIIISSPCIAQGDWAWANRSFRGGGNEGVSTCTDKEGNVFVAGILIQRLITGNVDLYPGYSNDRDIFVVKYDSSGNTIWGKRFGGKSPDMYGGHSRDLLSSITTDSDGGVVIAGYFLSDTIQFDSIILTNSTLPYFLNFFIARLDLNGNVIWAKKTIGNVFDSGMKGDLATDNKGNVYVTGIFESSSMVFDGIPIKYDSTVSLNGCYYGYSSFIAKYDYDGNILWAKTLLGSSFAPGIAVNSIGEIYLSGTTYCPGRTIGNFTLQNPGAFLAKLDTDGNALWVKNMADKPDSGQQGFPIDSQGTSVTIDQFDNVFITGLFFDTLYVGAITLQSSITPGYGLSAFIAKLDPNGNTLWAKVITRGNPISIAVNKSGNVFVTGNLGFSIDTTTDSLIYVGGIGLKRYRSGDEMNAFVAQYDKAGTFLGASLVNSNSVGNDITTFSDNVYVTGSLFFNPFIVNNRPIYFGDIELPPSTFTEGVFSQYTQSDAMFIAKLNPCHESITSQNSTVSLCPGDSITLKSSSSTNGIWSTGETAPSITVKSPGIYSIPIFNSKGCLINIEATTVTLRDLLKVTLNKTASFCPGDSIALSSTSLTNNSWSTGEISQSITVKSPGVYSLTTFYSKDCLINNETTTVTLFAFPKATVSVASLTICEGANEELISSEAVTYLWSTGSASQSITVSIPGSYRVTTTDTNGCNATSESVEIKFIEPLPDVLLLSDCNRIYIQQNLNIDWYQNSEIIELDSTLKEYFPSDSGYYHVEVKNICDSKKSNTINFKPPYLKYIFMPNVITPNGDPFNEYFVLDKKLSGSSLQVVNRWGNEAFYSNDYQNNWNGGDLASGTYYYSINNPCFSEKLKGYISIIK